MFYNHSVVLFIYFYLLLLTAVFSLFSFFVTHIVTFFRKVQYELTNIYNKNSYYYHHVGICKKGLRNIFQEKQACLFSLVSQIKRKRIVKPYCLAMLQH